MVTIIERILSLVAPAECIICRCEGGWLCRPCGLSNNTSIQPRCFKCLQPSDRYQTCNRCRSGTYLDGVFPAFRYRGVIKNCIWQLKFGGARSVASDLIEFIPVLPPIPNMIVVPVPTASSRRRQRGYDQAILLAQALAQQRRLPYAVVLRRQGHSEQLGASRQQRLAQLQAAYRCVDAKQIRHRHILLVDDVMTTGATLEAAARVLLAAGAQRVSAAIIAQA